MAFTPTRWDRAWHHTKAFLNSPLIGPFRNWHFFAAVGALYAMVGTIALAALLLWTRAGAEAPAARSGRVDMTLAAFKLQRPQGGAAIRCSCQLQPPSENGPDCPWYRIRVKSRYDEPWGWEKAWVYKDSPEGERLWKLLKDGSDHTMTLHLQYKPPFFDEKAGHERYEPWPS
jgi:hypothetical protein